MLEKKIQKSINKLLENVPDITAVTFTPQVFFGSVLGVALFIAVLLWGACLSVSRIEIAVPVFNRSIILENNVREVVSGYPIEAMAPYIALHDKMTAAFLVGIAKKESNWGKRVPRDASGADCYNYWGWRGAGSRGIEMGHGCFGSPEEAIGIVGGRLDTLIKKYKRDTPAKMIVWKCGTSCAGHSPASVKKWISDVNFYFKKID